MAARKRTSAKKPKARKKKGRAPSGRTRKGRKRRGKKVFRILAINPGSTSTKIAVYDNEQPLLEDTIRHSELDLSEFERVWDQYEFRKRMIVETLAEKGIEIESLSAVVGRGGLLRPVVSGTYRVNELMIEDGRDGFLGEHAANLGPVLAFGLGWDLGIPSFMVDPPSVDELDPLARLSGHKDIPRRSLAHALNIKATARVAAKDLRKRLDQINLIVAHLGGGISVCPLRKGRMIDANDANSGGPFTPERAGAMPTMGLIDYIFRRGLGREEAKRVLIGKAGLVSYLGTNSAQEVEERIKAGDEEATLVYQAMAYQVAKEIGAMATVLKGKVDAIVLTGGLARSKMLTAWIRERVKHIGPVRIYPGQDEMKALALGTLRVLRGSEKAKTYPESVEPLLL
jgi:butyrate kinase